MPLKMTKNIMIIAPTGSGKSYLAYKLIELCLQYNIEPIIYTTPFRVLTYQKAKEIERIFGIKPKIETGEYKSNNESPIIVCTQEIYEQKYKNTAQLTIIDEFHIIGDHKERALAYLKTLDKHPTICLSATIKITDNFKKYLEKISNIKWEIIEYQNTDIKSDIELREEPIGYYRLTQIIKESEYITAIITFSRKKIDDIANKLAALMDFELDKDKIVEIEKITGKTIEELEEIRALRYIKYGITMIHSKVPTIAKRWIIQMAERNLIKVIIGTDSFTTGTNFPIENIIFADIAKFDGKIYRYLTEKEFIQIIGRAGRKIGNIQIKGHIYRLKLDNRYEYENQKKYEELIELAKNNEIKEITIEIKYSPKDIFRFVIEEKDIEKILEDALPHLIHVRFAIEYGAAVDVHVLFHALKHWCVGGEFDRRARFCPKTGATTGSECHHVRATGDLSSR